MKCINEFMNQWGSEQRKKGMNEKRKKQRKTKEGIMNEVHRRIEGTKNQRNQGYKERLKEGKNGGKIRTERRKGGKKVSKVWQTEKFRDEC